MQKKSNLKIMLLNLDVVLASVAMCVLVACTFCGVIARYVMGSPFTWIEEIQSALIIWVIFGAAGAAFRTANHAGIEVFFEMFPEKIKKIISFLIFVVLVCALGYLAFYVLQYLQVFAKSGRTTPVLHISYILIYSIVPVSCIWQIFNYILVNFFHYSEAVTIEEITDEEIERAKQEVK